MKRQFNEGDWVSVTLLSRQFVGDGEITSLNSNSATVYFEECIYGKDCSMLFGFGCFTPLKEKTIMARNRYTELFL